MATEFDRYAAKGNEFVNLLANDLQVPRDKAMRILRAVLHATRNHLPVQESWAMRAPKPHAMAYTLTNGVCAGVPLASIISNNSWTKCAVVIKVWPIMILATTNLQPAP
jgi:uncharacterized protein (DUF2267 family)